MGMVMTWLTKVYVLFALGWLAASVFGCGALQSSPALMIVPISSFDQITGEWEGWSRRVPDMRDHAQVLLIIREEGVLSLHQ